MAGRCDEWFERAVSAPAGGAGRGSARTGRADRGAGRGDRGDRPRDAGRRKRLLALRGVGPTTATALVAALGTGESFARRAAVCGRRGLDSQAPRYRRQGAHPRHQQARRCLSAAAVGSRSSRGGAHCERQGRPLSRWINAVARPQTQQRRDGGAGQQDRAHGLGADSATTSITTRQVSSDGHCYVETDQPVVTGDTYPRLRRNLIDGEQVEPALAKPVFRGGRKARVSAGESARE